MTKVRMTKVRRKKFVKKKFADGTALRIRAAGRYDASTHLGGAEG